MERPVFRDHYVGPIWEADWDSSVSLNVLIIMTTMLTALLFYLSFKIGLSLHDTLPGGDDDDDDDDLFYLSDGPDEDLEQSQIITLISIKGH